VVRAPLLAVVALLATLSPLQAGAAAKGDQRVLVVLATAGSKPYTVAEVERVVRQADQFFRTASFNQVQLHFDVTPWLPAFTANPGCGSASNGSLSSLVAPARLAAGDAGYNAAHYDDVVYAIADSRCGFHGVTFGHEVLLTRQPTVELLVHELGHALGLGHAQSSDCRGVNPAQCGFDETGDPYSPMGSGMLDFSAYEKVVLGWLPVQPHVTATKRYVLAPPTFRSKVAQALVIDAEDGSWWIEYRAKPFRGLLVRFVENRDLPPFGRSAALMMRTVKASRPWIARGETYRIPSSFRVTLLRAGPLRAELRLR
jgi:hypothetical protein